VKSLKGYNGEIMNGAMLYYCVSCRSIYSFN